jgi:lipopolysaccharide export LptBFGC system permease protein LptF
MFGGIRSYIIFTYLKYISINILIFIGLIWLSQILRILELQHSITTQLFEVIKTTLLVLPSFIGPLMPFLLIIASFFLNYKFNNSNEIIALKQYFSFKNNLILFSILSSGIIIFCFINSEYLSVNLYQKYKIQELEIRNNLKLGVPSQKEFHIEEEVSIFFTDQDNNKFIDVEALIYQGGQFITSKTAYIEIKNRNYNLIFNEGERVILNEIEKSKTTFDKFVYSIENKETEILMYDREHFNTLQLLKNENKEFYYHGHNRVYQYILTFSIIILSFKIFFIYIPKKSVFKYYGIIFFIVLVIQVINSYLIYLLNSNTNFNLYYYYFINFLILTLFSFLVLNSNENN